jgi:hypothetical protein
MWTTYIERVVVVVVVVVVVEGLLCNWVLMRIFLPERDELIEGVDKNAQ